MFTLTPQPKNHGDIDIILTSVTGALKNSSDFTLITCTELTDLIVTGEVAVPDQFFAMPLKRDDGRLILFGVEIVDGTFTTTLNFPTSGQYVHTNEQANHDLLEPLFNVAPIKIDVLRLT